ncbi:MAG: hypothetical protein Tsb007_39730 [Rhizobacter sp.]
MQQEMFSDTHLVMRLHRAGSELGAQLVASAALPLQAYLSTLVPSGPARASLSLSLLIEALARHLHDQREPDADDWCEALVRHPMIQQADHSSLLLDHETLLNNVLFATAARLSGVRRVVTVQCSSVSCITQRAPFRGPPFLHSRGVQFNVFGRSIRTYAHAAFCALAGPVRSSFAPMAGSTVSLSGDPLLAKWIDHPWPSALDGMRHMNNALWRAMGGDELAQLLILDDRLSNELIALHVERPDSPIHRLLFDLTARQTFLTTKRSLVARPSNIAVNRAEPDFFWFRRDQRLLPVVMHDEGRRPVCVDGMSESLLDTMSSPRAVADALRCGVLVPDRVLIYFARCLLPGVRAIGGTSQQDYVALYRELLIECDRELGLLDAAERANLAGPTPTRLGGAPLIELSAEMELALAMSGLDVDWTGLLEPVMLRPLADTVGHFRCANYLERGIARASERQ